MRVLLTQLIFCNATKINYNNFYFTKAESYSLGFNFGIYLNKKVRKILGGPICKSKNIQLKKTIKCYLNLNMKYLIIQSKIQ